MTALYTGMKAGQAAHGALGGDADAVAQYAARLESVRAAYLHQHALYYGIERRWADQPCWLSRHHRARETA